MTNVKLIVVGGDAKRSEINLKNLPATIGRASEATITLPHALVSRKHCEIYQDGDHLCVRDLKSLNGTYLNNEKISGSKQWLPGQLLTLGNVTFRADYVVSEEPADVVSQAQETDTNVPNQADVDTDHGTPVGPASDTDEFKLDIGSETAPKSVSLGALADLPDQQPQASFQGQSIEVDQKPVVSLDAEEIRIDLGADSAKANDPSKSSLDEFFRKMPK